MAHSQLVILTLLIIAATTSRRISKPECNRVSNTAIVSKSPQCNSDCNIPEMHPILTSYGDPCMQSDDDDQNAIDSCNSTVTLFDDTTNNCSTIQVTWTQPYIIFGALDISTCDDINYEVIIINSSESTLQCGADGRYCIPLMQSNNNNSPLCYAIDVIYGFLPCVPLFDGSYPNSSEFADCSQQLYYLRLDYSPAYLVTHDCFEWEAWQSSTNECVSIEKTGCPRTPLACSSGCISPSIAPIPTLFNVSQSDQLLIYPSVMYKECESVYVTCPDDFVLATYNSFTDATRVYVAINKATVYCGKYQHSYYILYENEIQSKINNVVKLCSNSFDQINCIESTRSWPFIIFIDENQTMTVLSAVDDVPMVQTTNLHYCIDDLIERKMLKMQIADIDREILRYIIFIAAVIVLSILIIIAQCNFVRLQRRLSPYLPENSIDRFVRQHQLCRIRRGLHIDYDRRLGDGKWSKVYYGNVSLQNRPSNKEIVAVKKSHQRGECKWMNQIRIHTSLENHENIIRFVGFYISNRMSAICCEAADGGNLLDAIRSRDRWYRDDQQISVASLTKTLREIICGMIYLHENEILHRNLTASNVLLDKHGTAKICGFGLSIFFVNNSWINFSDKNDKLLPIKWMAIESIVEHRFSKKSDVWSFAVLLYELFTLGHEPYENLKKNDDIVVFLKSGKRLSKPEMANDLIFKTMEQCWSHLPYYRPEFDELHRFFCQF